MEGVCWRVYTNVRKIININVEILYVVTVCMPGEIVLEYLKVGRYEPDRVRVTCFLFV